MNFQEDVQVQSGLTVIHQGHIAKILVNPMDVFHGGKHVVNGTATNVYQKVFQEMSNVRLLLVSFCFIIFALSVISIL